MKADSNSESTLIYLDWNVMIDLYNGEYKEFASILDYYSFETPYTDVHIIEAFECNQYKALHVEKDKKRKFNQIAAISSNLYLNYESNQFYKLANFPPIKAYYQSAKTLEVIWDGIKKGIDTQIFDKEWNKRLSEMLIPKILNNKTPREAFRYIDHQLNSDEIQGYLQSQNIHARSFAELVKSVFGFYLFQDFDHPKTIFTMSYILLDTLGYWSEKRTKEKYLSLLADTEHAYLALGTSALITNDKKLKNKASAIYSYYKYNISVFTPFEFVEFIKNNENKIIKNSN